MIEIRCRNNRLLGEFDPDTLSFRVPCKTCTTVWGRPVFHRVPLGNALNAVGRGQRDGVLLVDAETHDCNDPDDSSGILRDVKRS